MRRGWAGLMLLGWAMCAGAGGVYKWVDEQGRVHYGERPPAAAKSQEMQIKSSPNTAAPEPESEESRQEQQQRLLRAYDEERALKKEAEEKAQAEKERREINCARARERLRRYNESGFLYDVDKSGERRILNDAERAAVTKRAQDEVNRWCK